MLAAGASRRALTRRLQAAYADGLISDETYVLRLDRVLRSSVVDPAGVVGDLTLRRREPGLRDRVSTTMVTVAGRVSSLLGLEGPGELPLLALDWSGSPGEMIVGRSARCTVVLREPTVSRRHARLIFRDAFWVVQDLASTNGTRLNGRAVGRCRLRPGDRLAFGEAELRVD